MSGLKEMDLTSLVGQMCASMLGAPAEESSQAPAAQVREVVGIVGLSSEEWSGSVMVAMPEADACAATAAMFMLGDHEVDDELVADAIGEFANVLAGMTKTAIGGGCRLSLPSVTTGSGIRVVVPGAAIVDQKHYTVGHGRMTVSTLERTERNRP